MVWNLRGHAADFRALLPKIRAQIQDDGYSLVIIDPTYKLLGECDENSATDIAALLNAVERLAVSTGAAVALANHYAKGNAAGKEAMDRISGSGVFARDPDSLVTFTRHEEDNAYTVDTILRNFPPVQSFVVRWEWPLFMRASELDPKRLRAAGGRPAEYTPICCWKCSGTSACQHRMAGPMRPGTWHQRRHICSPPPSPPRGWKSPKIRGR